MNAGDQEVITIHQNKRAKEILVVFILSVDNEWLFEIEKYF